MKIINLNNTYSIIKANITPAITLALSDTPSAVYINVANKTNKAIIRHNIIPKVSPT